MKNRNFTFTDQKLFAHLSGDYNPLHLDEIAARRLPFGKPVVHGVHVLLWALDCWFACQQGRAELRSLQVDFKKPVLLNETVKCSLSSPGDDRVKIEVSIEDSIVASIRAERSVSKAGPDEELREKYPDRHVCAVLKTDEAIIASGKIDLCLNKKGAAKLFPALTKKMRLSQLAEILAVTQLVGMKCPGYHSLLSTLELSSASNSTRQSALAYKVSAYDKRFSLLSLNVCGPSLCGTVTAFFRPPPENQKSFSELRKKVGDKEFKGQTALIIGGSRGLGEVTAKILAAGGAKVKITYYRGEEDAGRVVKEIISGGGWAEQLPFNVLDAEKVFPDKLADKNKTTHLYYFATPHIFAVRYKKYFSEKLFEEFCRYYVAGFSATVETLRKTAPGIRKIFYPSSSAIEELLPSLTEYACAKAAGETLCALLEDRFKDIVIYRPRLSRMATDQTVTFFPGQRQDPASTILGHLRTFRDLRKKK